MINGKICASISATKDTMLRRMPVNFEKRVKNIYRTLLTRGMKGCMFILLIRRRKNISGIELKNSFDKC
jgi:DUF2075 family protein